MNYATLFDKITKYYSLNGHALCPEHNKIGRSISTNEEKNVIEKQEPKKKSNVMTEISVKTVVDDKKEEKSAAVEEKKDDKAPAQTDKSNNNQYNNKNNKYNNNKH